jgi:hypothetical protein
MLHVFETPRRAARELFFTGSDRGYFVFCRVFGRGDAAECANIPADRCSHGFRAAEILPLADAVKFGQLFGRQ